MRSYVLAALALAALAPAGLAGGRNPGSLLVYPVHRSGPGFFTVLSVTNTATMPATPFSFGGTTLVNFEYVNSVANPTDPFLPCGCIIFNRKEMLTPADTLSVLTNCHNAFDPGGSEGYVTITAQDPTAFDRNWAHDYLIGSELVVNAAGGMYSLNAIPFASPQQPGTPTDVGVVNGEANFDAMEYECIPDVLYIDSFLALDGSSLALLNLTGNATDLNTVQFDIWNDNEFPLSTTLTFNCWFDEPLTSVSPLFSAAFLAGVPNDPGELDVTCNGLDNLETGWARIDSIFVQTQGGTFVSLDGALLGSITAGPMGGIDGGHLLWNNDERQCDGATISGAGFVTPGCEDVPQAPLCVITAPGPATVAVGETFSADYFVSDPDDTQVLVQNMGPAGSLFMPGNGLQNVPFAGNVSWTPDGSFAGTTQHFTVIATDADGGQTMCEFEVMVEEEKIPFCTNEITIDFDEDLGGGPLPAGTNVTNQYLAMFGFTVSVASDSNEGWIFDTANPPPSDLDLGTPNGMINGGPGLVPGGAGEGNGPGAGVNNDMPLGNVLVIQDETNPAVPDDDASGGVITITFNQPVAIQSFNILDAEENPLGTVRAFDQTVGGNLLFTEPIPGIGDNSLQTHIIAQGAYVTRRLEIEFDGSGALGEFTYCVE